MTALCSGLTRNLLSCECLEREKRERELICLPEALSAKEDSMAALCSGLTRNLLSCECLEREKRERELICLPEALSAKDFHDSTLFWANQEFALM